MTIPILSLCERLRARGQRLRQVERGTFSALMTARPVSLAMLVPSSLGVPWPFRGLRSLASYSEIKMMRDISPIQRHEWPTCACRHLLSSILVWLHPPVHFAQVSA